MFKKIETMFNISMVFSIVFAILGIVMIANPTTALNVICTSIAIVVIIKGIIWVANHFSKSEDNQTDTLVVGIVLIVLGIILMTHSKYIEVIVGLLVGISIILESVSDINVSFKLRKTEAPWLLTFCLSIITFIVGVVLVCNPQESAETVMIWSGISLLINSVTTFVDKKIFKKYIKEVKKVLIK